MRLLFTLALLLTACSTLAAEKFDWHRFDVADHAAFKILPPSDVQRDNMPWVLYAPTFEGKLPSEAQEGWMINHFLNAGIAVAGVDVGESYGSPSGRKIYDALYRELTENHGFGPRANLLARSRGGLMLYCWAAENPQKVKSIAAIYPVCDLRSYPGLDKACGAYGMTSTELAAVLADHNPVDCLSSLAKAKVPIFHIHGADDKLVPFQPNTGTVAHRYQKLGGTITAIKSPKQSHNMWHGFFHSDELVDFVVLQATGEPRPLKLPEPIAHWPLDEISGVVAEDKTGRHHGRIVGAKPSGGKVVGARLFDRADGDHIVIEYSKDFDVSSFTVSAWVKLTKPPTFSGILGTRFGRDFTFDMKVNAAKVHGDIGDGKKWLETAVNFYEHDTGSNEQGGQLQLDRWYHIVYVINDATHQCRLYLDGDLKKTIAYSGSAKLMNRGQEMRIGNSSGTEFMDGHIDDVRVWSSPLSTRQVQMVFDE